MNLLERIELWEDAYINPFAQGAARLYARFTADNLFYLQRESLREDVADIATVMYNKGFGVSLWLTMGVMIKGGIDYFTDSDGTLASGMALTWLATNTTSAFWEIYHTLFQIISSDD